MKYPDAGIDVVSDATVLDNMDFCAETARDGIEAHDEDSQYVGRYRQLAAICAELIWRRRFMRRESK